MLERIPLSYYSLSGLFNFVTSFALSLFVFLKSPRSRLNQIFSLFSLIASSWGLFYFLWLTTNRGDLAELYLRALMFCVILVPPVFTHFILTFLKVTFDKKLIWGNYFVSAVLASTVFTEWFAKENGPYLIFPYWLKPGPLFHVHLVHFLVNILYAHFLMLRSIRKSVGVSTNQILYIFVGTAIGFVSGITNYFTWYRIPIPPFLNPLVFLYVAFIGYAIVKYRLLDITTVIHKTMMWITTSIIVLLPTVAFLLYFKTWIISLSNVGLSLVFLLAFALMIPYLRFIQPRIDHFFQRRQYNMQKILHEMIQELATLRNLDNLLGAILNTIREALYVSKVSVLLWNANANQYRLYSERKQWEEINCEPHKEFLSWLGNQDRVVEIDEMDLKRQYDGVREAAKSYLSRFKPKICLPISHNSRLIGVINLGEKENLRSFSRMDVDFLVNLRAEASIALSNSLLYDDVQKMSDQLRLWAQELEHKVEDRTRELSESKAELERSYQKLQELDHLKSQFFANISHELRTPLTLILAPLESYLHRNNIVRTQQKDFEIMYQNGLRLLKQINNLLDLAKIDSGKMQISYAKTDLIGFIKGVVASVAPMADKKGITLSCSCESSPIEFYLDRDKVERVLLNLIFNALKFTESGGKVRVSCEPDGDQALVKVADTGIGISADNLPKLFNRFSQVDASPSRRYEGTGIGLALAKEMVELHKGKIWATSEAGKGTVMTFSLPCLPEPKWPKEDGKANYQADEDWTRSITREAEYSTSGILQESFSPSDSAPGGELDAGKILVVEDNADMLRFIVTQLQEKYQVISARNGIEGVRRAKEDLPDLILSDVMMPYKDGYQLCQEVKADPTTTHIPVILVSAKADISMKIEGLEYGADDYLAKPFSSEELRARVKSLLNLRSLERAIQSRNAELQLALRELKSTQEQLVHSEKMAALGLLVAGLAHEINNPVTFAKGSLSTLRRSLEELQEKLAKQGVSLKEKEITELVEDIRVSLSIIRTGLDRTEAIVGDLKSFVRKDEVYFKPTDLHQGIDTTLSLLMPELADRIFVVKEYGEICPVEVIPGRINQVFMNLLQNAIHAIRETGEIRIRTWKEHLKKSTDEGELREDDWVKISVKDTGVGISEENLKRIFEPFFTTKEVGKGMGLGLSVSYQIIQNHDGEIDIKSAPGEGTEVILTLPVHHVEKRQPEILHGNIRN